MEEEKRSEWEVAQTNETVKTKKKTKSFIVKYIIFVIILIIITAISIVFSMKYIDKTISQAEILEESELESSEKIEETKMLADDSIYGIKSYSETYDTNSLEIKRYYNLDGNITSEDPYSGYETRIEFIQIEGLKNKEIQDRINAKLKNVPYTLEKEKFVWSSLTANFSNVLSVVFSSDKENAFKTLNFDLITGEEITFENLFVSSAPIKSMIASGIYEKFAWDKLYEDYEGYNGLYDMENADTSEIEEQFLLAAQKYDKIKDDIVFYFTQNSINILNPEFKCTINMSKYANEIAIYKRYLTEESIFENDDLGTKGTIVFTEDIGIYDGDAERISYGKITDNIFVEEILFDYSIQEDETKIISDYVKKLSAERKTILRQETPNNKGRIFQGEYHVFKNENNGYYEISVNYYNAECSLQYFEDEAFKDYIEVKGKERADVGLNAFALYMREDYPELNISNAENKIYYLSFTGEFLGNTEEEVKNKTWE